MEFVQIAKIVATHGLKGEVIISHVLGQRTHLKGVKAIFIEETKNNKIPWFLVSAQARTPEETIVLLEGLNTKEAAKRLVGRKVWMTQEDFSKLASPKSPIAMLGFTVYDRDRALGQVEEVIEQPHQVLLQITYNGKEALIPVHEEFLTAIDHKNKKLFLNLPNGLLDIYE